MEKLIDTNIIIRIITNDNPELAKQAVKEIEGGRNIISHVILAETIYVLSSVYSYSRNSLKAISLFINHPNIYVENSELVHKTLEVFFNSSFSFQDCYLISQSVLEGKAIVTQDKKLKNYIEMLNKNS